MNIAVVGMGFIFPGGITTSTALWSALAAGKDMVGPLPPHRPPLTPVADHPNVAGFLENVTDFDAGLFAMNGLEARSTDPQQRLLLQTSWAALEDGGFSQAKLADSRTGVFVGAHGNDYLELATRAGCDVNAYWNAGLNTSILANRLSYFYNWRGPSVTLNTACSSSLEALTWAVDALDAERCDMAMVCGINLVLTSTVTAAAGRAGMLSPTGRCRTFDRAADGFVRGEGVIALLLKPLAKARAEGDRVHAIIRGAATAHGGHAHALTTPNLKNQRRLLMETYRRADIPLATITYLEAHGTGTTLGDSIEVAALKEAFAAMMPAGQVAPFCGLGSIKTNLGHLESAAGLAGVVSVCQAMSHGHLPKLVHFSELNPLIELKGSPFYIVDETMPWTAPGPRRAGISSFGFGGSYAHVILEEPPPDEAPKAQPGPHLILLSARHPDRLDAIAADLLAFLASPHSASISLAALAFTLQTRQAMTNRLALVIDDLAQLKSQLEQFLRRENDGEHRFSGTLTRKGSRKVVAPSGDLAAMAQAWVAGGTIDPQAMYPVNRPRPITLPHYPFAQKRYWLAD